MDVFGVGAGDIPLIHDDRAETFQTAFQHFLSETKSEDNKFKYRSAIDELIQPERNTLTVDLLDLHRYNHDLYEFCLKNYYRMFPYLCRAVLNLALADVESSNDGPRVKAENRNKLLRKQLYVSFENIAAQCRVRELTSDRVGQLVRISGQVVRTHPVHPELWKGAFICDECNATILGVEQQFKYTQPLRCSNVNCPNPRKFRLDMDHSMFVDFQRVRIQEVQAELPRGSIPRSLDVILRGECVESVQPGDRCEIVGTLIVIPDVSQIAIPGGPKQESGSRHRGGEGYEPDGLRGLKSLGVRDLNYKLAFLGSSIVPSGPRLGGRHVSTDDPESFLGNLSQEERDRIKKMARDPQIEVKLVNSLFPSIYGCETVKKGVLLMLFGGIHKETKERISLRGDINICIVGDPSTAKSQVLKQVEEFSPRAVYTSGKASSAAGLTAAVVKDEESFEFVIEAGAMMLADNGICCIDEFDKMDPKDQVAIHEAMEQQTISITKAGVKATLNARTSVLAAANPIGGRYDRSRSLRHNINMSGPILSRFDLFFVLVDESDDIVDYAIAKKILDTHRGLVTDESTENLYSRDEIRNYINCAKLYTPEMTDEAEEELVTQYKVLRQRDTSGSGNSSWRITVRQLESMIRLSEALARLRLKEKFGRREVLEAYALLSKSILRVEQPDIALDDDELTPEEVTPAEGTEERMEDGEADAVPADRLKLSFDEYKRISCLLVQYIRRKEEELMRKGGKEKALGLTVDDLKTMYLEDLGLDDEQEVIVQSVIVSRVIQRLVTHDNVLIELTVDESEDAEDKENEVTEAAAAAEKDKNWKKILVVHPNFVLDDD